MQQLQQIAIISKMKTSGCFLLACSLSVYMSLISGGYSRCSYCIADSQVPDSQIQNSLDWVCESTKESCNRIQPGQPCYNPNDIKATASVAFNEYWQLVKHSLGAKCDIFGAALLTNTDPSQDNCPFGCIPRRFEETN